MPVTIASPPPERVRVAGRCGRLRCSRISRDPSCAVYRPQPGAPGWGRAPARLAEAQLVEALGDVEAGVDAHEVLSSNGPMRKPPPTARCDRSSQRPRPALATGERLQAEGPPERLTMKPGTSAARITSLPIARPVACSSPMHARRRAAPDDLQQPLSGAGLKKCMPTTRSGCVLPTATAVIGERRGVTRRRALLAARSPTGATARFVLVVDSLGSSLDAPIRTSSAHSGFVARLQALTGLTALLGRQLFLCGFRLQTPLGTPLLPAFERLRAGRARASGHLPCRAELGNTTCPSCRRRQPPSTPGTHTPIPPESDT